MARSAKSGCSTSTAWWPRRQIVASPRASARAAIAPPSPRRIRLASLSQSGRRSKNRYGVAAAAAPSAQTASVGDSSKASSWPPRNFSRSSGSEAKAVMARWRSTTESPSTQSSKVPSICSSLPVRRPSARAAWIQTKGSGCNSKGCSTCSVRPISSGSAMVGIPETLTSKQRAANTRPRRAPRAGACTICSKVDVAPNSQRPRLGTSSALAPASQIKISSRARASEFCGSASFSPSPINGAHASASSSGPSSTRPAATAATRSCSSGCLAANASSGAS